MVYSHEDAKIQARELPSDEEIMRAYAQQQEESRLAQEVLS